MAAPVPAAELPARPGAGRRSRRDLLRLAGGALALAALAAAGAACGAPSPATTPGGAGPTATQPVPPPAAGAAEVRIVDFGFEPGTLTVPVGTAVTWRNTGATSHTTTSGDKLWDSGNLAAGASFTFTFSSAGRFAYACSLHGTMRGTIEVR